MSPRETSPRVTIAMPVYNGERTVASAIECLLAQTFEDFELVIGDNASTDATVDIAKRYATVDRRIRLLRNPVNRGVHGNYSSVAREARGEYLKWASCNDWCAPTFVERCVAVLDARADVVLAYPKTRLFDATLDDAEDYEDGVDLQSASPSERLLQLLSRMHLNNAMNGLIRVDALRQTHLIPDYRTADIVMAGHLALLGKFVEVPERLFYRRMNRDSAAYLRSASEQTEFFHPGHGPEMLFQHWRSRAAWVTMVMRAPISVEEKARILPQLLKNCYWDWRDLARDIGEAGRYLMRPRNG